MQDDAGRTGAVPESSAPHTVHEIELAWEGAEVNFKDRLVGALLSRHTATDTVGRTCEMQAIGRVGSGREAYAHAVYRHQTRCTAWQWWATHRGEQRWAAVRPLAGGVRTPPIGVLYYRATLYGK